MPLGPQQTVNWSRGISTSMPLRLCCRAPRTLIALAELGAGRSLRPRDAARAAADAGTGRCTFAGRARVTRPAEPPSQHPAGVATRLACGHFLGRAGGDDRGRRRRRLPGPRSMIQSAVLMTSRLCSTTSTVLPASTKPCSTFKQQLDVGEVQPGRRLVEQIERPAGALLDQFAGELDPLGLAAGERGRGLAELHVVQAPRRAASAACRRWPGMFSKCARASWTSISSTSAIDLPL